MSKVILQFPINKTNKLYFWANRYYKTITSQNRQVADLALSAQVPVQLHKQIHRLADKALKTEKSK